jgi:transposase-like protein
MTKQTRRKFSADFKAKVALEAIKNQKTLAELSQQYEVNAITIARWKSEFLERMSVIFTDERSVLNPLESDNPQVEKLYAQIGQLKVELDFLKKSAKKLGIPENEWRP